MAEDKVEIWAKTKVKGCQCFYCRGHWSSYNSGNQILPDGVVWNFNTSAPDKAACALRTSSNWGWPTDKDFTITAVPEPPKEKKPSGIGPPGGVTCKKCKFHNPWGANNQPDDTYICYECKR